MSTSRVKRLLAINCLALGAEAVIAAIAATMQNSERPANQINVGLVVGISVAAGAVLLTGAQFFCKFGLFAPGTWDDHDDHAFHPIEEVVEQQVLPEPNAGA